MNEFLDEFIERHGWWAARAAWVGDAGMVVDPWRLNSRAPSGLDGMRLQLPTGTPIDPGEGRYPDPRSVPVDQVKCTIGVAETLNDEGIENLVVVDVAGILDFDVRLVFAAPPGQPAVEGVMEALRTGATMLPRIIRHEMERDVLRSGALRDPLTGLLNRAGLDELSGAIDSDAGIRAVIFVDLDRFKEVNDAHGHAAGDEVLVEAAKRLVRQVRPTDLVARVGGDEFVIVAVSVLDESAVVSLAQRLVSALSQDRILANGAVASVAASAGVVIWDADDSFPEAVSAADALMYEAKRIGGGIAMQDATGRILVRDPHGDDATPEQVERGRAPVRAQVIRDLRLQEQWGVHLVLRGELCSVPREQTIELIDAAIASLSLEDGPRRLVLEPRGRGWSAEGLLQDVVERLIERNPAREVMVLVDGQSSSTDLRLVVDEIRASMGIGMVLGGIGSSSSGDLRLLAQTAPDLLALDREVALNLERTQPPGIAATLAAAVAAAMGSSVMVLDPPATIRPERLAEWGCALAATSTAPPQPHERLT